MDSPLVIGGIIAVIVAIVASLWGRRANPVRAAVVEAIEAKDIGLIMRAMEDASLTGNGNLWNKTLGDLWSAYERELTAKLLAEAAKVHTSDVIKVWTQKIVEIEPDLALKTLGRDFILEKLELPEEAIPMPGSRPLRKGERAVSKKKPQVKKKKKRKA